MTYKATYKCRLCGKTYTDVITGSENIAIETIVDATLGIKSRHVQSPTLHGVHTCSDGNMGITDFLGYVKENFNIT